MTTRRKLAAIWVVSLATTLLPSLSVEAAPTRGSVQARLDKLANEISVLNEEYNVARIELTRVENQIRSSRFQKQQADEKVARLRNTASQRAAAVYRAGVPDILVAIFTSNNADQFGRRMEALGRIQQWQSGVVNSLEIAGERAESVASDLEAESRRARSIKDSIAARRSGLIAAAAEQRQLLAKIAADEAAAAARARRAVKPKVAAPVAVPAYESLPGSPGARIAVQTAYAQIGKPYRWGASGPDSFDCSGLTMYSWARGGVALPHSSRAQYSATRRVAREDLQPGDLVFFGSPIHHVGIYIGGGNMINAPETGKTVGIRPIARRDYVGAGRPGV